MFPLSSKSAEKFNLQAASECAKPEAGWRPKSTDGVINLYRLPSDQLSFLEQYVAKLNEELEEHTAKLAEDWKASLNQEFLDAQEVNKTPEPQRKPQSESVATQNNSGDENAAATPTEDKEPDPDDTNNAHMEPLPGRHWSNPLGPNPALFETPWTIEDVELSFIPETVSLESTTGGAASFSTFVAKSGKPQGESRKAVMLEVATNSIAPESLYSLAILLSRCTGVEIPLHSGRAQSGSEDWVEEKTTTPASGISPSPGSSPVVSAQWH